MIKTFVNAVCAGIFIGIAGTVYLATANGMFGAVLFGFGLMMIVCCKYSLFTGAVGYLVNHGRDFFSYLGGLAVIWAGNLVGTFLVGTAIRCSRTALSVSEKVSRISQAKIDDSWQSLLILAFFCGILMYCAVETSRRTDLKSIFRFAGLFLPVCIFILSGFEHCIANMFYFSLAGVWSVETLGLILLMTLGNALGGMLLPAIDKIRN